jgi:hypothetical protein
MAGTEGHQMLRLIVSALILGLGLVETPIPVVAQRAKTEPMTPKQVWSIIKAALMAPDGDQYFENNLKGSMVPGGVAGVGLFTGTLLSAEPAAHPSTLVISISDGTTPEVTLHMKDSEWKDTYLNGPVMRGSVIQFEGVPILFTKEPFMLTLGVSMTKRSQALKVAGQGRGK